VILPRGGYSVRGFNARARMLKRFREDRDGFEGTYHRRSLADAVFSSIKARFGGAVSAMSISVQSLRLTLKVFCYNPVSWKGGIRAEAPACLEDAVGHQVKTRRQTA